MTSLTTFLLLVALMQTAATLPMLLLELPAATADIFDRRQLLLFWQAIVPELVPRSELMAAIALNSAGFNIARAVGTQYFSDKNGRLG